MPIDDTLRRVSAELDQGRVIPAIRRLRSLVRTYPERLDLRSRLADVYRGQGELAQAGRWSFLAEDADPADLAAFERAYRSARGRLRALAWPGDADADPLDPLGPLATERLAVLQKDATAERGDPASQQKSSLGENLGCALAAAIVLLAVLGFVALVVHGVRVLVGWF